MSVQIFTVPTLVSSSLYIIRCPTTGVVLGKIQEINLLFLET